MDKVTVKKYNGPVGLVPWKSKEELSKRISDAFDHQFTKSFSRLTYEPGDARMDDLRIDDEIYAIMNQLPKEHEINREIIKQAKNNLVEITTKSPDELRGKIPKYLNSFWIGEVIALESIFTEIQNASYYIINNPVLTTEIPPKEESIMFAATKGMGGYNHLKKQEFLNYLTKIDEKKFTLPFLINDYGDLKNKRAVDLYFNLFNHAEGNNEFILNDIKRNIIFPFIGRRLKRNFPGCDFQKEIDKMKPELKSKLEDIFNISADKI
jgi:hypothetical protein